MINFKYFRSLVPLISILVFFSINFLPAQNLAEPVQTLSATETHQFLNKMVTVLKPLHSFQAEFTQERQMAILTEPIISKGVCRFEEPNKLRWEIVAPYHSILIYNKEQIAKFEARKGQIKKLQLGAADIMREILKQIISWMKGDFNAAQKMYDVTVVKQAGDFKIVLIPKAKELLNNILSIELSVAGSKHHVTAVVIRESAQDLTTIRFFNQKDNLNFSDQVFDLSEPESLIGATEEDKLK